MANLFETFAKGAGEAVGAKVGTVKEGTPTPADLYSEAAPKIVRALNQYDAAAPLIDVAIKYWWLVTIAVFGVGVAAGYAANYLYDKTAGKRR